MHIGHTIDGFLCISHAVLVFLSMLFEVTSSSLPSSTTSHYIDWTRHKLLHSVALYIFSIIQADTFSSRLHFSLYVEIKMQRKIASHLSIRHRRGFELRFSPRTYVQQSNTWLHLYKYTIFCYYYIFFLVVARYPDNRIVLS